MTSRYSLDYAVKTEDCSSPDLSPTSLQHFQFQFTSPSSHTSSSLSHSRESSDSCPPIYRFGQYPSSEPWPKHQFPPRITIHEPFDTQLQLLHPPTMYSDEYDDGPDGPFDHAGGSALSQAGERLVRKRSSKACDQCRKSKCKCERSGPNEPCKSCIMLGTACTFLGPSRKRGPPKGYIDAIEARLHQTEALLGIMLATTDPRAQSLLKDIRKDSLAKEIISRVDNSPYGVKGRKREDVALTLGPKGRSGHSSETSQGQTKSDKTPLDITSTHPSNEWQDRVSGMLNSISSSTGVDAGPSRSNAYSPKSTPAQSSDDNLSPDGRRQRRRVDDDYAFQGGNNSYPGGKSASSLHHPGTPRRASTSRRPYAGVHADLRLSSTDRSSSMSEDFSSESEEDLTGAVGQLSLNEEEEVRYHGTASGLHLLVNKRREDERNEGGIWRFPGARVWPPLPSGMTDLNVEDEFLSELPSPLLQQQLLDLYFTYVHPFFPILHKQSFLETYKSGSLAESPQSSTAEAESSNTSPFSRRRRRIPTLLLFAIFSVAARYDSNSAPRPSDPSLMWEAGDAYLQNAKVILGSSYASSRPSTCQALLLMGYREIGIGAMAQAWTYIGMCIRMAQDLGMHREAGSWERSGLGGRLFSDGQLDERKRIWFACVIMDKYVSTYIGRPLMIFERDFDNTMPNEEGSEEFEEWTLRSAKNEVVMGVPGRIISCFNASAGLSNILSMIVQAVYAIRQPNSRHAESLFLESQLNKWYLDLPEHLRWDPSSAKQTTPLPNVLAMHMQYWCAVLLLHRPFIRQVVHAKDKKPEDIEDLASRATAEKSYDLCNAAANHITSTVAVLHEKYSLDRCPAFLTYYIFTACIMHVTHLTLHPSDPQSRRGLSRGMAALQGLDVVWPSAGRALALCKGANVNIDPLLDGSRPFIAPAYPPERNPERNKRSAEQAVEESFGGSQTPVVQSQFSYMQPVRQGHSHSQSHGYPQAQSTTAYGEAPSYLGSTSRAGPSAMTGVATHLPPYSWQGDDINAHSFTTPLSTGLLPQTYSIGMIEDHIQQGRMSEQSHLAHPHHARRYSTQYYEYPSNFQLSQGYELASPIHASPQPPANAATSQSPQAYLSEQYNIYNNPPYNGR